MTWESSIAPRLLRPDRRPKHTPGSYTPPYPSFSARFGDDVDAVVMASFGVQSQDADDPRARAASADMRAALAALDGAESVQRARYVDAHSYTTTIDTAYWSDPRVFERWFDGVGAPWLDPARVAEGVGRFLELVTPDLERFETIFSAPDRPEGVAAVGTRMSGMIEEHAYWGSMRDRLPLSQTDPLWPSGDLVTSGEGRVREVRLHGNACLIRSGQDITDTGDRERDLYLTTVEPPLRAGMDFLRDEGGSIGCYDNRFMVLLDDDDQPTDRTFGMSWWRDMAALEDWAASHRTHVEIFGAAMRHLSSFGPETRLRLFHEVTVPTEGQQRFVYVGCHDETGLLRART